MLQIEVEGEHVGKQLQKIHILCKCVHEVLLEQGDIINSFSVVLITDFGGKKE